MQTLGTLLLLQRVLILFQEAGDLFSFKLLDCHFKICAGYLLGFIQFFKPQLQADLFASWTCRSGISQRLGLLSSEPEVPLPWFFAPCILASFAGGLICPGSLFRFLWSEGQQVPITEHSYAFLVTNVFPHFYVIYHFLKHTYGLLQLITQ